MRAIIKTEAARGASYVDDFPEPSLQPGEVLLEVRAASICGTDREFFEWSGAAQAWDTAFPVVMGHEMSGVVLETAPDVDSPRVGDRVAVETHIPCGRCFQCRRGAGHNCLEMELFGMRRNGCFAERIAVPARVRYPLPEQMSFEDGALLEPAGVAWHAISRSGLAPVASSVLVTGCGPIGIFVIRFARAIGATQITAVDPNPHRRRLASELGARVFAGSEEAAADIRERHAERQGVDVGFDASGAPAAIASLFEAVRREGTVVTIGHPARPIELDVAAYINKKGLTLRGVFGREIWRTWQDVTALVSSGAVSLSDMISHRLPLAPMEQIMDVFGGESNKIVLLPQGR